MAQSSVRDTLVLYIENSTEDGERYVWDIPKRAYYGDRRGSVAYISCVGAMLGGLTEATQPLTVCLHGVFPNAYHGLDSSKGFPIAYCSTNSSTQYLADTGGFRPAYLIGDRPDRIEISIRDCAGDSISATDIPLCEGCFIFEISYYGVDPASSAFNRTLEPSIWGD